MVLQVPQVGETLPTLVTNELFLPGMYLLVGFQAVALVKAASACVAGVRLLSRVDALMSVQVTDVAETLPTGVTAEWFLPCVDHLTEKHHFNRDKYTGSVSAPLPTAFANPPDVTLGCCAA